MAYPISCISQCKCQVKDLGKTAFHLVARGRTSEVFARRKFT
jgi:hypothetical protein